jgi:hypothetical protein
MRRSVLLGFALAAAAAPVSAQGFEGTVMIKGDASDPNTMLNQKWSIKGSQMAITGTLNPASANGMTGEIKILVDWATKKSTTLIPIAPEMAARFGGMGGADMKGIKMVADIPAAQSGGAAAAMKKLGTSQTIAGFKCDDYEETGASPAHQMCISTELGKFTMPGAGGGRGRAGGGAPSWAGAIGDAGFPLKVWTPGGKVDFEVTSVEKGSVAASVFEVPAGYVDMGRGRGGE